MYDVAPGQSFWCQSRPDYKSGDCLSRSLPESDVTSSQSEVTQGTLVFGVLKYELGVNPVEGHEKPATDVISSGREVSYALRKKLVISNFNNAYFVEINYPCV